MNDPSARITWTRNAEARAMAEVPAVDAAALRQAVLAACAAGARLSALVALPGGGLLAALADAASGRIGLVRAAVEGGAFPSLTRDLPEAQALERALFESSGLRPEGHPRLAPLRLGAGRADGDERFFEVHGEGVHEVAVGPVHAGIIEPGHFRFQCSGETVHHLEIRLGYQHRGIEALLLSASPARRRALVESVAGDSVVGHAFAALQAEEALGGTAAPPRAAAIRSLALELERLASHVGDLGALCGDVGYLPGASFFGRLRGDLLNLLLELSGSRFARGLLVPGGVRFDLDEAMRARFASRLREVEREFRKVAALSFEQPSVLSRFEGTGVVRTDAARRLGLVGPAARASGLRLDVRRDHPFGAYAELPFEVASASTGDVLGRAQVRRDEALASFGLAQALLAGLPAGPLVAPAGAPREDAVCVSLVEGWRGEIAHVVVTGEGGARSAHAIVDPSVHDWFGLAMAMRETPISDFPLCNKSFNLSYAGHDL